jgi:hypothetical protein
MFLHPSTATGQNYRNGVGSGYAMRTYKDLDKAIILAHHCEIYLIMPVLC